MDINDLRGITTLLVMIAFLSVCVWAYNPKRKKRFEDDAKLPFSDEPRKPQETGAKIEKKTSSSRGDQST